uniref:Uncharacterized protein n=1 Tax=Moniliophthora roreri TaxID=221103 RepID=A0A0W0FTE8_MONRR
MALAVTEVYLTILVSYIQAQTVKVFAER